MYNFKGIFNPIIRRLFEAIFDTTSGHNHDGSNSKSVTTGTPGAGTLTADVGGRAIIANDYFDAATFLAKFATDSIDNAQLLKAVKNGAFLADAATRALFADSFLNAAKLADNAKTRIFTYIVEDLGAGVDIVHRAVMVVPTGYSATVIQADMIPLGAGAGIDDSNNCLVGITDGVNSIAYVAFDTSPGFPSANTVTSLGEITEAQKTLAAGEKLCVDITNGATANPPAMLVQVTYVLNEA